MSDRANYLEPFQAASGAKRWYVRLVFSNGEKAMVTEGNGYTRRWSAVRAMGAIEGALAIGRFRFMDRM